ncbi:putative Pentatricopeptide repeat-containing protein [Hibiscus syriacus]|uniref:Pentatricopeptide repeat-containing protein n=1 Tax=Hibiscus syriacus TaxID=106335 RepID=A0A6A2Y1R8_HIBSY|nr:putative Pentatricopeptide repeat-containing protein [Hibiscus syriacus]
MFMYVVLITSGGATTWSEWTHARHETIRSKKIKKCLQAKESSSQIRTPEGETQRFWKEISQKREQNGDERPIGFRCRVEEDEDGTPSPSSPLSYFDRDRHVAFFGMLFDLIPYRYQSQEISRLTLAFFTISGLHLLKALDRVTFELFVHNAGHMASPYCALAILKTVGFNILTIDKEYLLISMRNLQQPDGSFMPVHVGTETDLRFSYDDGFGLLPGLESHGGDTYCAVASLRLMGYIEDDLLSKKCYIFYHKCVVIARLAQAIDGGFQGRANKSSDTCYAFWVGAVLRILGGYKFIDKIALRGFFLNGGSKPIYMVKI